MSSLYIPKIQTKKPTKTYFSSSASFTPNNNEAWYDRIRSTWLNNLDQIDSKSIRSPINDDITAPNKDFLKKIADYIQYDVLSDYGLIRDKYIFAQLFEKKSTWVSIKFLSSFRRVKQLAKDWRIVALALCLFADLGFLEISKCGTKLRRLVPVSQSVRDTHKQKNTEKTKMVVIKIHDVIFRNEALLKTFLGSGTHGIIPKNFEKVVPGVEVKGMNKSYSTHIPDLGKTNCCIVDYKSEDDARQMVRNINGQNDVIRAAVLASRVKKTLYDAKKIEQFRKSSSASSGICTESVRTFKSKESEERTTSSSGCGTDGGSDEGSECEFEKVKEDQNQGKRVVTKMVINLVQ